MSSYDTVDREILWKKMGKLGFPKEFINCLKACSIETFDSLSYIKQMIYLV